MKSHLDCVPSWLSFHQTKVLNFIQTIFVLFLYFCCYLCSEIALLLFLPVKNPSTDAISFMKFFNSSRQTYYIPRVYTFIVPGLNLFYYTFDILFWIVAYCVYTSLLYYHELFFWVETVYRTQSHWNNFAYSSLCFQLLHEFDTSLSRSIEQFQ